MGESITKSELRRSCSLDFLLIMAKVVLLQSHPICTSGFQEGLLGQRRPTTLVRQRLVAPPSNSQLSPTSHLFSLSTTVLLGNLPTSQHQRHGREKFKNPLWWVSVHIRSSDSETIHIEQQTNTCINPVIIFAFSKSRMLQSQTAIWKYSIQI